jgi:hypothetical protein
MRMQAGERPGEAKGGAGMTAILVGFIAMSAFAIWMADRRFDLGSGHKLVLAQLKQLTQEINKMATQATISAQALADLQAADADLKTAITQLLTYIQTKLGGVDTDDSAAVEAAVTDINAQTTAVLAAIAPPATPAPTPAPTPSN